MKITCHYCGEKVEFITKDHIVPKSLGGVDRPWNIVQSCFPCNSAKSNNYPTCDCYKCQRAIQRHAAEGWTALALRQIPMYAIVTLRHPRGSTLVGRKSHSGADDLVAVAGLGDFALHKMKRMGWQITVEHEGAAYAPSTKASKVPA